MRDERVIANEIEVKRANLEHELSQLRAIVVDKLDVVRRVRARVEQRRDQLLSARDTARARIARRPFLAVGLACAAGMLLALLRSR